MKNIKKYILGFLATLMLCITSVVNINNTQNDIVVNAEESSDMVYVGTPINPTGTYDKIYFNTSLSNEEIVNLIESLNLISFNDVSSGYLVYLSTNSYFGFGLAKTVDENLNSGEPLYTIITVSITQEGVVVSNVLWQFSDVVVDDDFEYWNIESPYVYELTNGATIINGISVGQQNELLYQLISSTPFKYVNINDTEIVGGTAISSVQSYDMFYVNTLLDNEFIISILDNLFLNFSGSRYSIYSASNCSFNINKTGDVYYIDVYGDNGDYLEIYDSRNGFHIDNSVVNISLSGGYSSSGLYNDLLIDFISGTPYYRQVIIKNTQNQSMISGLFGAIITGINGIISPIIKGIENGFTDLFVEKYDYTKIIEFNSKFTFDEFNLLVDSNYKETKKLVNSQSLVLPLDSLGNTHSFNSGYIIHAYSYVLDDVTYYNYLVLMTSGYDEVLYMIFGADSYPRTSVSSLHTSINYHNNLLETQYIYIMNNNDVTFLDSINGYEIGNYNDKISYFINLGEVNSTKLSSLGIFLMGMFGLAIAFGLIWLIISIFKNRK